MSKHKLLATLAMLALAVCAWPASAAAEWTVIGNNPFCRPPLKTEGELRDLALAEKVDLQRGFAEAGYADLYPAFEKQVETAQVDEVTVQPGEKMRFMLYRKKGEGPVRVAKDVTWRGKEAFEAYRFHVDENGKRYTFVVPKGCGNFALWSIGEVPAAPVTKKTRPAPPNRRPECRLAVSSEEIRCGNTVVADASGSRDPDGRIAQVVFQLFDPAGKVVWEKTVSRPPFKAEVPIPCQYDAYQLKAIALDDQGDRSLDAGCSRSIKATQLLGGPVVDFGYARVFDPADYAFGRVGYELPLVDRLHVMGMIGGFGKVAGCDGDSAFVADVTLNYHWAGPLSVGFGAGYWSGDDGQIDLIGNVGIKVFGDPEGFNGTLFAEVRSATGELDKLDSLGRYALGLRLRF
jgi:hypothetical protein